MTSVLLGQIFGIALASGLNLYLTVVALGVFSRVGVIDLPHGLQGLEGTIVLGSALLLYIIEAVVDKIRHIDSLWDTIHTFIRPPAAALLTVGALWNRPDSLMVLGAGLAVVVALAAHVTKAGLRLTFNVTLRKGQGWISAGEDLLALAFAVIAFLDPDLALLAGATVLAILLLLGPRYWRAFHLGLRCLRAAFRALFTPGRWREGDEIPSRVRSHLDPTPLGAAPPRGTRAALDGLAGVGAFRNGWLVVTGEGLAFVYGTLFGGRRVDLPAPPDIQVTEGVWADIMGVGRGPEPDYHLFLLKDGPPLDLAVTQLRR